MSTLERIREVMLDVYSISNETRAKVRKAYEVEQLIELLAREYPPMAQAICLLRVMGVLSKNA